MAPLPLKAIAFRGPRILAASATGGARKRPQIEPHLEIVKLFDLTHKELYSITKIKSSVFYYYIQQLYL